MEPSIHLLINNIFSIVSAIVVLGTALFTYLNGRRSTANIMISLAMLMIVVFYISHVIGTSVSDPEISRLILLFNLCMFPAGIFQTHAIIDMTGTMKEHKAALWVFYVTGIFCLIFFLINPDLFLHTSVPKMYFPNYYEPGVLNWTRMAFLSVMTFLYSLYILISAYRKLQSPMKRSQYKYFIWSVIGVYAVIFIPNFLVYNIPVDPLWGSLAGVIFVAFFLYGAVRYELFNIYVVAKQAFFFALAIGVVGGIITIFNYSNVWMQQLVPTFPLWITALISAVLTVTLSTIIWQKLRQNDLLKYEFITTATHKFRTPLTQIKWAAETLEKSDDPVERRTQLEYIQSANGKLVELTNLLVNVSEAENSIYEYHLKPANMSAVIEETLTGLADQFSSRHQQLIKDIDPDMRVLGDISRLKFIVQTFVENAIHYTPMNGTVTVSAHKGGRNVVCSVKDNGIGITKEDLPNLFTKFYRGHQARLTDTEGVGIGLFISKEIALRHKGKVWAESSGTNQGSTFNLSIPLSA